MPFCDEEPPEDFLPMMKRPDLLVTLNDPKKEQLREAVENLVAKSEPFPWKYNEGRILSELEKYLRGTYGEHYVSGGPQGVQEFDVMEADGELGVFSKQSARKYLRRYGKKDGCNRKDLLKVLHYTIILLYLNDKENLSGNQDCQGRTSKA